MTSSGRQDVQSRRGNLYFRQRGSDLMPKDDKTREVYGFDAAYCASCGHRDVVGSRFCTQCGATRRTAAGGRTATEASLAKFTGGIPKGPPTYCVACQREGRPKDVYCIHWGTHLQDQLDNLPHCSKCLRVLPAEDNFCVGAGTFDRLVQANPLPNHGTRASRIWRAGRDPMSARWSRSWLRWRSAGRPRWLWLLH
jgi:hypothetical protein